MIDNQKLQRMHSRVSARQRPKGMIILRKARHMRRWLVKNPWTRPMCVFNYAAILIQKLFRGSMVRKLGAKHWRMAIASHKSRKVKPSVNQQLDKYLTFLESYNRNNRTKPTWLDGGYSSWCAVKIQSVMQMYRQKRRYLLQRHLVTQVACIIIQTAWRNKYYGDHEQVQPEVMPRILTPYLAAQIIQLKWRSYCNIRIYKYFRELIKEKLKGAPYDLLRAIIPNESDLLDRASGVHVRFRLGGNIFPPKIYFKIYTHRPLCDVNAFAPRDYKAEKMMDGMILHNKAKSLDFGSKTIKTDTMRVGSKWFDTVVQTNAGTENWYKRDEKNNWRAISSHLFENILTPPWFKEEGYSSKPKPFHFSSITRINELKKLRKRKRRAWMVKACLMASANENSLSAESQRQTLNGPGGKSDKLQSLLGSHGGNDNRYYNDQNNPQNAPPLSESYTHDYKGIQSYITNEINNKLSTNDYNLPPIIQPNATNTSVSAQYANQQSTVSQKAQNGTNQYSTNRVYLPPTSTQQLPRLTQKQEIAAYKKSIYFDDSEANSRISSSEANRIHSNSCHYQQHQQAQSNNYRPTFGNTYGSEQKQQQQQQQSSNAAGGGFNINNQDLIDWSLALNFDVYADNWNSLGTSMPSNIETSNMYSTAAIADKVAREKFYGKK